MFVLVSLSLSSLLATVCLGGVHHGLLLSVLRPASNYSPVIHQPVCLPLLKAVAMRPLSLDYCVTLLSVILGFPTFRVLFMFS